MNSLLAPLEPLRDALRDAVGGEDRAEVAAVWATTEVEPISAASVLRGRSAAGERL